MRKKNHEIPGASNAPVVGKRMGSMKDLGGLLSEQDLATMILTGS